LKSIPKEAKMNQSAIDESIQVDWRGRIISDPEILVGKPVIKGTRISFELLLGWLANGWTFDMIIEAYPHISREDILAALVFTVEMMHGEQYIAKYKASA
jgi:uncharacterized protein (DUF433 family)